MNYVRTYLSATCLYGLARGVAKTYDTHQTYYNSQTYKREKKPLLLSETVGNALQHAAIAPIAWPGMLGDDAVYMELYLRKKDPAEYQRLPFREAR